MDFFSDKIRSFFGLRPHQSDANNFRNEPHRENYDDYRDNGHYEDEGMDDDVFRIFNESLEMHRNFEKQFGDMMKIFSESFPIMMFQEPNHDNRTPLEYREPTKSIRDEYLKPGFQSISPKDGDVSKDTDLDGVIAPEDIGDFMKGGKLNIVPRQTQPNPPANDSGFFGRVVITRTVTKPDGTVETRRTIRDSRTNEEETTVTVTHKDDPRDPDNFPDASSKNIWDRFFRPK